MDNPIVNLTSVTVTAFDLTCESGTSGDALDEYATSTPRCSSSKSKFWIELKHRSLLIAD